MVRPSGASSDCKRESRDGKAYKRDEAASVLGGNGDSSVSITKGKGCTLAAKGGVEAPGSVSDVGSMLPVKRLEERKEGLRHTNQVRGHQEYRRGGS